MRLVGRCPDHLRVRRTYRVNTHRIGGAVSPHYVLQVGDGVVDMSRSIGVNTHWSSFFFMAIHRHGTVSSLMSSSAGRDPRSMCGQNAREPMNGIGVI